MGKYRNELNLAMSKYMDKIIVLNQRFQLYNATDELRKMYHPAIEKEAKEAAQTASNEIDIAYKNYLSRLDIYCTMDGTKIDDNDIKLLNPAIFHLTQGEFDKLWEKHSGNSTMEAALRSYANSIGLLFSKSVFTRQQKEELAKDIYHEALNGVRKNNVYELADWFVSMKGELFNNADALNE